MAFSFGAASTAGSSGFSFGATTASATTAKVQPFSFGGNKTTAAATGFNPGSAATSTTSATGFNLGSTLPSTAATGFNLGSTLTSTAGTGFNLGSTITSTAATGFNFGTAGASTAASGFKLGSTTTSSAPATGFNSLGSTTKSTASLFGSTTTSASTGFGGFGNAGGGFKLGGSSTASSLPSSGFSFGGISSASTNSSSLTSATTNAQFKGLGGTSITTNASSQNSDGTKSNGSNQALREETLLPELTKDVQSFEKFMKNQKDSSDVVGKFSVHSLKKIQEEVATLSYALGSVSSALHRNTSAVQKLKNDFLKELKNMEMARHTKDIPPSMQHDNISPIKFFMDMVVEFEGSMQVYRKQIEELENHLNLTEQTSSLTAQDIYLALCKMQESFISLAANLHSTHDQVKQLKENYLIYRRIVHNDSTDIFAENRKKSSKETTAKSPGVSALTQLNNFLAIATATMANQPAQQQGPPQQGFLSTQTAGSSSLFGAPKAAGAATLFGGNTATTSTGFGGFSTFGTTTTKPLSAGGFGSTSTASTGLFGGGTLNTSAGLTFGATPFELKRPPLGNKRGKK